MRIQNYILAVLCVLCSLTLNAQYVFTEVDIRPGTASTSLIGDGSSGDGPCLNNKYFSGINDSVHGLEMWISDGTVAGTQLIKDINPGTANSLGSLGFPILNGKGYFAASDGINGMELWVTDGTAAGTNMVADINVGAGSSNPTNGIVYNGKIYFSANSGSTGMELWVSDGTASGTQLLKDINPGLPDGLGATVGTVFNGKLYFQGFTPTEGGELWVTDGTASGTVLLKDIVPGSSGGFQGTPLIFGSKMYFLSQTKIWATDGTAAGTQIVPGQPVATNIDKPMVAYNGKIYYITRNDIVPIDIEVWSTDGIAAPQMLKDIWPGVGSSLPENLKVYNGKLYFSANDSAHGRELWVTDGTTAGTQMVKDIRPGLNGGNIDRMCDFAGKLIFKYDASSVMDVMVTDGTAAGTMVIQPPNRTFTGYIFQSFYGVAVCNNIAYVHARYNDDGKELWMINDTSYHPPTQINTILKDKTFAIAPNPAADNVSIKIAENNNSATLTISNMMGQRVYEQAVQGNNMQTITLNLSSLARGSYIVSLRSKNVSETQKLVLE